MIYLFSSLTYIIGNWTLMEDSDGVNNVPHMLINLVCAGKG